VPPWTWNVGPLAPGANAVCHLPVSINPMPPGSISNTATVTGAETDPVAGNNSDTEGTTLDATPPEVDLVNSVAGTGDGALSECETARVPVATLLVTFSEDVAHASAADPQSATNPANYRLVAAAPGAGFDTTSCASGTGGDTVVPIGAVAYDSGSHVATVPVDGGTPLPDAQYRLLVCGTVEDLAGNQLDGGGGAGTDFPRSFRVDRFNLLDNGHFDCDISGWSSAAPAAVEHAAADAAGAPISGSAHNADPFTAYGINQCVPVQPGAHYDVRARVRVATTAGHFASFVVTCTFYAQAACAGAGGSLQTFPAAVGDSGGTWLPVVLQLTTPANAASARCRFSLTPPSGISFDGFLDNLFLGSNVIFADGFETGDTARWSLTVP
jgi:Domain of unknown function DUF11